MSKLTNVRGRITYISSHAKQENLYAVYETTERNYWTELARYNQQEFKKSNTPGKCIEAREERNSLEEQRDNLKGLAKLTKKGELQEKIDSKNEQIETLKKGLKGIVWRYGFQTVQDFYRSYHASTSAYRDYQSKVKSWESTYGIIEKKKEETLAERMVRYEKEKVDQHYQQNNPKKDRGAR